MRSKILDCIEADGNHKCLAIYDDYANGRISINEAIKETNRIVEETQLKIQNEINRILTIECYYK